MRVIPSFKASSLFVFLMTTACTRPVSEEKQLEAQTLYEVGVSQLQDANYPDAISNLHSAYDLRPDSPEVLLHLGLAYLGARRLTEAEKYVSRACSLSEKYALCWNNLSAVYLAQGRFAESVIAAEKAIEIVTFPSPHLSWGNKGDALFHLGELADSRSALEKALKYRPQHCRNRALLSRTLLQMAKFEDARQQSFLIRKFCPAEARILLWDAYLSYRLGYITEARKTFEAIVSTFNDKDSVEVAHRGLRDLKGERTLSPPEL